MPTAARRLSLTKPGHRSMEARREPTQQSEEARARAFQALPSAPLLRPRIQTHSSKCSRARLVDVSDEQADLAQVMLALLNRQPTFLASDEWQVVPWEHYPKSPLDYLLDLFLPIPELFVRADAIIAAAPTIARRLKAQDLLSNCEAVEKHLDEWYACFNANSTCKMGNDPADSGTPAPAYWPLGPPSPSILFSSMKIPFAECVAFRDGLAALAMATYWAGQILLYETVDVVHLAANAPSEEDWSNMNYPDLPSATSANWQTIDRDIQASDYPLQQQQSLWRSTELAGMVCRGLDFALESGMQVDTLVAPFTVAYHVFRGLQATMGKAELELAWCEEFRERLVGKGQAVATEMMAMGWEDVGRF